MSDIKTYKAEKVSKNKATADILINVAGEQVSHHINEADIVNSTKEEQLFMTFDGVAIRRTQKLNGNDLVIVSKTDTVPGLPALTERIEYTPAVNKIPLALLRDILASFKAIYEKHHTESAAQIYRKADGTHFVYYPKQKVFGAHVDYSGDDKAKFELRQVHELVMELHSHANMGAFFSGGDDANEKFPCLYTVIGKFGDKSANILCRIKFLDMMSTIPMQDLFDIGNLSPEEALSLTSLPEPNKELLDNVIVNATQFTATTYSYYGKNKSILAGDNSYKPSNYRYTGKSNLGTTAHPMSASQPEPTYYSKATTPQLDLEWIVSVISDAECTLLTRLLRDRIMAQIDYTMKPDSLK